MKKLNLLVVFLLFSLFAIAQQNCIDQNGLVALDTEWEQALLKSNVNKLDSLMADDFIWVHNQAKTIDTKATLLQRASDPERGASGHPLSRTSYDVKVIIMGSTGVVTGFTIVDRGIKKVTYNFMRTYAEIDGKCFLLANHTMEINDEKK